MNDHNRMKKVYSLLKGSFILFLFPFILGAHEALQSGIFLFNQFTNGKILLTDKRCIETQFNYNCEKQELYYKDGNEYQMIYNTSNIDTLYIQNRKFIPSREGASFLECIPIGKDTKYLPDLSGWATSFFQ